MFGTEESAQIIGPIFKGQAVLLWPLEMGPEGCPETSIINCHYTLRKVLKGCRSHLHVG
jgi:hypothetical protein